MPKLTFLPESQAWAYVDHEGLIVPMDGIICFRFRCDAEEAALASGYGQTERVVRWVSLADNDNGLATEVAS